MIELDLYEEIKRCDAEIRKMHSISQILRWVEKNKERARAAQKEWSKKYGKEYHRQYRQLKKEKGL